jgi:hypothetical protein
MTDKPAPEDTPIARRNFLLGAGTAVAAGLSPAAPVERAEAEVIRIVPPLYLGHNQTLAIDLSAVEQRIADLSSALDAAAAAISALSSEVRHTVSGAWTVYVDPANGNDNSSGAQAQPLQTIKAAIALVASRDLAPDAIVKIQLAPGIYDEGGINLVPIYGSAVTVEIVGDDDAPDNYVLSSSTFATFWAWGGDVGWHVHGLKIVNATGSALFSEYHGYLAFSHINFGACASSHLRSADASTIDCRGDYSVTGGASRHVRSEYGGFVRLLDYTCTLTGTPAFTTAFVQADMGAMLTITGMTFSGAATGKRYDVNTNAVIQTGSGGNPNYFPGDVAGTTATGGQYL